MDNLFKGLNFDMNQQLMSNKRFKYLVTCHVTTDVSPFKTHANSSEDALRLYYVNSIYFPSPWCEGKITTLLPLLLIYSKKFSSVHEFRLLVWTLLSSAVNRYIVFIYISNSCELISPSTFSHQDKQEIFSVYLLCLISRFHFVVNQPPSTGFFLFRYTSFAECISNKAWRRKIYTLWTSYLHTYVCR